MTVKFVAGRVTQAAITLFVVSFVVFVLGRTTGNPADTLLPIEASLAERTAFIQRMGLDRPIPEQYWIYLTNAVAGDFGTSLRTHQPVQELAIPRLVNSLGLASVALTFALLLTAPLGILAAVYRGRLADRVAMAVAVLGQSLPSFWVGILGILVFSVSLRLLPTSGTGGWEHYILPAITMGWFISAGIVRLLRSSMLEVLSADYVKVARSKGLTEFAVITRHALRNALIPVITFVGLSYGSIIGAAVTTEVVFTWPGLARLAYEAVQWRDFPLLQFTVLTWAAVVVFINLVVDIAYGMIDPRIRI